jgi:hypothetical protein
VSDFYPLLSSLTKLRWWSIARLVRSLLRSNNVKNLDALSQHLTELTNEVNDRVRCLKAQALAVPDSFSADRREKLTISVQENTPPWATVRPEDCNIPGMISREERRYYQYIGQFYSGQGEVVELGPWLGCSTFHIVEGLKTNPHFSDKTLRVYDDFIWRAAWMNDKVRESERLLNHQDFQFLFEKYTSSFQQYLHVEKRMITNCDGNDHVPQLVWGGAPIEILYVDCGRTFEANDAWYRIFCSSFIPEKTLLIMQDWRLHREVPVQWYNQTKQFTDSKDSNLHLIHEVQDGGIATFLYRTAPTRSG